MIPTNQTEEKGKGRRSFWQGAWPWLAAALVAGLAAGCAVDGKAVFEKDCLACHRFQGVGGAICPDLTDVASRRDDGWIHQQIKDSSVNDPASKMPGFPHLSDKEIQGIVDYLKK